MQGAREQGTGVYTAVHEDPERASNEADRSRSSFADRCQVFWMTMLGNFALKSSALRATATAVLRAISL
jgi:hypothetical protein